MDVTAKLVRVFLVDKQLRGLKSRLESAERFLDEQSKDLDRLLARRKQLDAQQKQLQADEKNDEGEIARLDAKLATLREQMNTAQTNKEYKAFLTELNTFKAERDTLETAALEKLAKRDEVKKQIEELDSQKTQREQVKGVAVNERAQRAAEIKERVDALAAERATLAADVPKEAMAIFEQLIDTHADDAMAVVEVEDRKRHEFFCAACRMTVPVESVNALMSSGKLTRCVSCRCILYMDDAAKQAMQPAASKR